MLIESCAGLLERDNPVDCMVKEVQEETGYPIDPLLKIFEAYMSPDSVTAYAMIAAGDILDGKTIMLLQYAKINNLLR